ncbi:hypothetical protein ACO0R3_003974 [Hanseniaspora guilliermondii]
MSFASSDFKTIILTFKDSNAASAFKNIVHKFNGEIVHEYSLIKGLAIKVPKSVDTQSLKNDESHGIVNAEEDQEVKIN